MSMRKVRKRINAFKFGKCFAEDNTRFGSPFKGHRPVIVKWPVIGSKVRGSSAQYISCKVFRDWSIINIWEKNHI